MRCGLIIIVRSKTFPTRVINEKQRLNRSYKHQQKIDAMMSGRDFALIRIGIILLSLQKKKNTKINFGNGSEKVCSNFHLNGAISKLSVL